MSRIDRTLRPEDGEALDLLVERLPGASDFRLVRRRKHRGSVNLVIDVTGEVGTHHLFVKRLLPHASKRYRLAAEGRDRPRMKPIPDPTTRLAEEALALDTIDRMVADAGRDDWFAVPVVPVDGCPDLLVLERIDCLTLADSIAIGATGQLLGRASRSLGQWLRALHDLPRRPSHSRPHFTTGPEVAKVVSAMIEQIGDRRIVRCRDDIMEVMADLPATMPVVASHGDLAPQNVFVSAEGAVAVFDTSIDLLLPRHFDLAYLPVMMEFADFKRPVPNNSGMIAEMVRAFRSGYGRDAPPSREVTAFEIALLLDRWCSLAERRAKPTLLSRAARRGRRELLAHRLHGAVARRLRRADGLWADE